MRAKHPQTRLLFIQGIITLFCFALALITNSAKILWAAVGQLAMEIIFFIGIVIKLAITPIFMIGHNAKE